MRFVVEFGTGLTRVAAVSHRYRRQVALAEVDLQIRPGVTGLLGVNGAGKTTLLTIMSGALKPTTGDVWIGNASLYGRNRREALRRIASMPQGGQIPRGLTGQEFCEYLTWMRGSSPAQARQRAAEAMKQVNLASIDKPIGRMSGGMQRRVWLAQALAAQPDVLLLDEPSTGLDPRQRAVMVKLISRIEALSVVVSSHVIEDVNELAGHVVVLDAGRVVYDGARPARLDTQWFLSQVAP